MEKQIVRTRWSSEEKQLFKKYFQTFGNDFKRFDELLQNRTESQIRSFYHNVIHKNKMIERQQNKQLLEHKIQREQILLNQIQAKDNIRYCDIPNMSTQFYQNIYDKANLIQLANIPDIDNKLSPIQIRDDEPIDIDKPIYKIEKEQIKIITVSFSENIDGKPNKE
ncbi:SANT/Myb_domain [Hexamita inflata]|uniref:SANT/Myb domain n=1 Tax=Hexamita inflata TaxID=28002 RepID=A0AA86PEX6_9EUKA|nr:SANT/Myb domain [Hexamita inflata]